MNAPRPLPQDPVPIFKANVFINTHNQSIETVHQIVASILNRAGCERCGRLAFLDVHFRGDPGPDLAKNGVISLETQMR